jgi:ABC-type antimicrobial peptide transport system permease subunit
MTEFGIRMAMGARASDVLGMVLTPGPQTVSAFDPLKFCAMALLRGLVTAACITPARRATKVDPLIALRYE